MADNNNIINIGGVRFDKKDVKSSEKIEQDGKVLNSVFLRDGTHMKYENQASKNESIVIVSDIVKRSSSGLKMDRDGNVSMFTGNNIHQGEVALEALSLIIKILFVPI